MSSLLIKTAGLAGAGALVLMTGAAAPDQDFVRNTDASGKTCFHVRDVEGYSPAHVADRDGVNIRLKNRDVFQLEFFAPCNEARLATRIRIQANSAADYVCSGSDATLVVVNESGSTQQCVISGLRKLDKAQVAALPDNEQP